MNEEVKNITLAIVLSTIVLFGWSYFFPPSKTPIKEINQTQKTKEIPIAKNNQILNKEKVILKKSNLEKEFNLSNNISSIVLTNSLKIKDLENNYTLFAYKDIFKENTEAQIFLTINNQDVPLTFDETPIVYEKSFLKLKSDQIEEFYGEFRLQDNGLLTVNFSSKYPFILKFKIKSSDKELSKNNPLSISTEGSFKQKAFVAYSDDVIREDIASNEVFDSAISWIGVDFYYHLFAFSFKNKTVGITKITEVQEDVGEMIFSSAAAVTNFSYDVVFAKKDYDLLNSFGNNLHLSLDFGIFSVIAVPLMRALQFFYDHVKNYGVAIILLTLLIRLFTFPFTWKQYKSMKKMQKIQPELNKLREKYKDDQQRMQKETMELFKRSGANPLGGCLPIILQLPIFFAFYRMLNESTDLVQAPFFGWITDLSIKDPYYILPILMTITMFVQQKLTPTTTADPNQRKMMMFMPVIFCVFMLNLPAGLTLYICISTFFGIAQQLLSYKYLD